MSWRRWLRAVAGWFRPRVEPEVSTPTNLPDRDQVGPGTHVPEEPVAELEQPPEPPTPEAADTESVAESEPVDEQPAGSVVASLVPVDLDHPAFLFIAALYECAPPAIREALAALPADEARGWIDQTVLVHNGVQAFQRQQQHEARLEWLRGELYRLTRYGPRGPRDSLVVGLEALSLRVDPAVVRAVVQAADRTNGTQAVAAGRRHRTPEAW